MNRFVGWFFQALHIDNWRWLMLATLTLVVGLAALVLLPYALSGPDTPRDEARRELYEFANRMERDFGGDGTGWLSSVRDWTAPILHWLKSRLKWCLRNLGTALAALACILFVATVIYFFPAFWDDVIRQVAAMRSRIWGKYSAEEIDISNRSRLTQRLLGIVPPAGATPPVAPVAGGAPLTKRSFLFWEAIIDVISSVFTHTILDNFRGVRP
jgi:hypothetical protein